ncbi:MAG: hypothetical protein L6416_09975 [Candidatus Omnitrophica bacterium]|nr:hypothetical protein [Candidatus Omnitrophota bacterium]
MGRIIVITLLILSLSSINAMAIPSEGNFLPASSKTIWGFQFNNIFSRGFNKAEGKGTTKQYFLKASYALTERFFLDGKIGMGSISFKRNDGTDLDFSSGFAGGYGLRYLVYQDEQRALKSIVGFQHISCHPFKDTINDEIHRVIWDEWQGTWLFIKEWKKTALYFGPQYSAAQLKYKVDGFRRRLKAEDSWGLMIGGNYRFMKKASISAEIRVIDEWAINTGICYKF